MSNDTLNLIRVRAYFFYTVLGFPLILCWAAIKLIFRQFTNSGKRISGEVALVTGGGSGLGRDIAMELAARGCHVAVADISQAAAEDTARNLTQKYGVKARAFRADVSNYDEVKDLAKSIEEQLGSVTILVNNAAMLFFSRNRNPPPEEIQRMINTNILSHIWTIRVFLDKMRLLRKGHIVAIGSFAGIVPMHRELAYTASKFAVRGLMMALRTELFALNSDFIKTTTVYPFFLNNSPRIVKLCQQLRVPTFSPADAARATVEGIVNNRLEVFIPAVNAVLSRILDVLPKDWHATALNETVGRERIRDLEF